MLKIFPKLTALLLLFSVSSLSATELSPQQWVTNMVKSNQQLNYDMTFITLGPIDTLSLRYRHVFDEDTVYAQLLNLDNSPQEIVQRGDIVSYFANNYPPFSIESNHIVDQLPNILRVNISDLTKHYEFIDLGRNRIANRVAQTIRIQPKDNFRYQYVVFIDEETQLLLRSDMLDRDGNLLEQFRVVNIQLNTEPQTFTNYLAFAHLPPLVQHSAQVIDKNVINWTPSWLPQGFTQLKATREKINNQYIDSQLYTDGLFSFSLYVSDSPLPDNHETVWKQGSHTIYSETINKKEITLIGQIPLTTAKRIVQDIQFK
ncbi:sigma-E factor regulatory protein RseB [Conservatibacter flavescens]|uniref:Sigma-E factor regulatory protein RseB n=2 Tax=Conservatibacter flavescens TaxID=28161 RepID=A0A2M8S1I5_9PAST|nr:sigma-E factor regulatory protein RseB [Conservatibacter flavescens]PJG84997.1 sigma-E factor regulatory protein RseB [Conservatibacter flavescens]